MMLPGLRRSAHDKAASEKAKKESEEGAARDSDAEDAAEDSDAMAQDQTRAARRIRRGAESFYIAP